MIGGQTMHHIAQRQAFGSVEELIQQHDGANGERGATYRLRLIVYSSTHKHIRNGLFNP